MWCRGLPLLGLMLALTVPGVAQAGDCVRANEDGAIAEGRLIERDDAIILKLPKAMCLEGPEDSDSVRQARKFTSTRSNDGTQETLRKLIGKDVHLEGSFMGAMTQHHKAPIVMQVDGSRRDLIRGSLRKKVPSSRGKLEGQHRPEGRGRQSPGGNRELPALHMEYVRRSKKVTIRRPPRSGSSGCR